MFKITYLKILVGIYLGCTAGRAVIVVNDLWFHRPCTDDLFLTATYLSCATAWLAAFHYRRIWEMADELAEQQFQLLTKQHIVLVEIKRIRESDEAAAADQTLQ